MSNLGEQIYRYRTQKGLSQQELAEMLDVSRQSVSKWEVGGAVPDLPRLIKMAALFGVTLDDLVSEKEAVDATAATEKEESSYHIEKEKTKLRALPPYWRLAIILVGIGIAVSIFSALMYSLVLSVNEGYPPTFLAFPLSFHLLNIAPFLICAALCLYPPKHLFLSCIWVVAFSVYIRLDMHFAMNWYDAVYTVKFLRNGKTMNLLLAWLILLLLAGLVIFTVKACLGQVKPLSGKRAIFAVGALILSPCASGLIRYSTREWRNELAQAYPGANDAAPTLFGIHLLEWACDLAVFLLCAYLLTRLVCSLVSKRGE